MSLFQLEPMKYWSMSSSMDREARKTHLNRMIDSSSYIYSRKYDGNWSRAVITPERQALQTRGISKVTGTYGEIQDRVFFWDALSSAFSNDTVILGEIYLEGGIDRDVGSILRSKPEKAKSIQDEEYYYKISKTHKFTPKDRRDIEGNKFRNQKLSFRIFDVLYYEGENLMNTPVVERIKYIEKIVKAINHPLIRGLRYFEMDENFFDNLARIFADGGEGVVCYKKDAIYIPGKRGPSAWDTVKVKQELNQEIDCFITGIEPAVKNYTGKELGSWQYWINLNTEEKLCGDYFTTYRLGDSNLEPISRGYYHGWPGAIYCSVWDDNNNPITVCKCAGLTDEFKEELKNNYEKYHMMPVKITGMMVSSTGEGEYSIRHPKLIGLRDTDIDVKDCTLEKLKMQS